MGNKQDKMHKNVRIDPFKVILIGEPEAGKTSILLRYAKNQFISEYKPTKNVRIENVVKKVNLPGDVVSSVTMWDLPGTEDVDLRETYFRDVDAAIVVVDMTDKTSIELAGAWKQDFANQATRTKLVNKNVAKGVDTTYMQQIPCDGHAIPVLLLGNKYDQVAQEIWQNGLHEESQEDVVHPEDFISNSMPKAVAAVLKEGDKESDEEPAHDEAFPQILGPKQMDKKPANVVLLEKVEEEFGFVGSVMVSAKDGDLSVHLAVQSLVRYLLQKELPQRKKKQAVAQKKIDVSQEEFSSPMQECGDKQFDELFTRCHVPLRRSGEYIECYNLVLRKFKERCAECEMLQESRPSLEDCILGIRRCLHELGYIDLKIVEAEDFVFLEHTRDHRVKVPREVGMCLDVYNKEFVAVCKAILRDCPSMEAVLCKLDGKICSRCENIKELLPKLSDKDHARIVSVCDKNRARIGFARKQLQDCIIKVEAARQKTKASVMWKL